MTWGYLGDDYENPAVQIELDASPTEGAKVGKKGKKVVPPAKKAGQARPATSGEKIVQQQVNKAQAQAKIREMIAKTPKLAAKITAMVVKNPVGAAKAAARPIVAKKTLVLQAQTVAQARKIKAESNAAMAQIQADVKKALASGAMKPEDAKRLLAQKRKEIRARGKMATAKLKSEVAKKKAGIAATALRAHAEIVKKRGQKIDLAIQKAEAERRKVQTSDIKEPAKSNLLKAIDARIKRLQLARKEGNKLRELDRITEMQAKGVLTKEQALKAKKELTQTIAKGKAQREAKIKKTMNAEKIKGRLYVLGKWIKAYEGAISFAEQSNATWVTIPLTTTKSKSQTEVKIGVKEAKVKLEKFRAEYAKLEKDLAVMTGETGKVPPLVMATTQTGQPLTLEMIRAQESFLRKQIAAGKIDPVKGAAAIKHLNAVRNMMVIGQKPSLKKDRRKVVKAKVQIDKQAMKYPAPGERTITTKPGAAKTITPLPKPAIPSAIPSQVAKTAPTPVKYVQPIPAKPPTVIPAAAKVTTVTPTPPASISKMIPGKVAVPGSKVVVRRKPKSITPFKRMDLNQWLDMFTPPKVELKKKG
jgi:hypothetical protein